MSRPHDLGTGWLRELAVPTYPETLRYVMPAPPVPVAGQIVQAISLHEPFASLMRTGAKTIETRHWPTNVRGWLLICAAMRHNKAEMRELLNRREFQLGLQPLFTDSLLCLNRCVQEFIEPKNLYFGHALCLVYLYDCRARGDIYPAANITPEIDFGNYGPGRYGWLTHSLHRFRPFPIKGKQGFFRVTLPDRFEAVRVGT